MAENKSYVHTHHIYYDDESDTLKSGIYYLKHDLEADEVNPMFQQAIINGYMDFEDKKGHNLRLKYSEGHYKLCKRY